MQWWVYVIVFAALIAIYLLTALIIYLLMKKAYKKAKVELDKIIPYEKERYETILKVKTTLENEGRFFSKNIIETTEDVEKQFSKIPVDIAKIKNQNDFLVIIYRKYIKEKRLLAKSKDLDQELENILYIDPSDKSSPYYPYDKAAMKYNSYVNMGMFNIFRGRSKQLPTL